MSAVLKKPETEDRGGRNNLGRWEGGKRHRGGEGEDGGGQLAAEKGGPDKSSL